MEAEDRIKALVDQLKVAGLENTRARAFVGDIAKAIQYSGSWESPTFGDDVLEAVRARYNAYVSEADENIRLTAGFAQAQEEIAGLKCRVKGLEAVLKGRDEEIAALQARAAAARLEYATLEARMEYADGLLRLALRGGRC